MEKRKVYDVFFPEGKDIKFRKLRWTIMIILQELSMCKYKAVLKFYFKKSYRKDIKVLRDILSKGKLKGTKTQLPLKDINFSHEINYPSWVIKLCEDLKESEDNYKRVKVFYHNGRYIVVDGNHRLKALKLMCDPLKAINVLELNYKQ